MTRRRPILLGSAAAVLALVTACSSSGGAASSSPPSASSPPSSSSAAAAATSAPPASSAAASATSSPAAPAAAAVIVAVKAGHLVAPNGRTLYLLTSDKTDKLACTGSCLSTWPPLEGKAKAGAGVAAKGLATVARGSTTQVTFGGHPLYEFAGDSGPGTTKGDGIKAFGGTWQVAKPADDSPAGSSVPAPPPSSAGGGGQSYP